MINLFHPSITKIRKSLKSKYNGKINLKLNKDNCVGYDTQYDIILRKSFLCFKYKRIIGSISFSLTNVTLAYDWRKLDLSMSSLGEYLYYLFREHIQSNPNIRMKLDMSISDIKNETEIWYYNFETSDKIGSRLNDLLLECLCP